MRVAIQGYPLKTKTFAKKSEAVDWGRSLEADLSRGKLGTPQSFGINLSIVGSHRVDHTFTAQGPEGPAVGNHGVARRAELRLRHDGERGVEEQRQVLRAPRGGT